MSRPLPASARARRSCCSNCPAPSGATSETSAATGSDSRRPATKCLAILAVLLLPAPVHAQGSLTGMVRDASGAVLPGVTVEVSSPVLIEKTRTAVTDGTGQYRIIDLRPGVYALTA